MTYRPYAGIGSRMTPEPILKFMRSAALRLYQDGWTVRTGGAEGADTAIEGGATPFGDYSRCELYLPWAGFVHRQPSEVERDQPQQEAYEIARRYHPAWDRLSRGGRALHARNVHQMLGPDVTKPVPSRFVLCWTPDARGGGGTGQALRIARDLRVPVFDLADMEVYDRVWRWLRPQEMRTSL